MMRIQEKTTLLSAARLILRELPEEYGEEVCEERYPVNELQLCKDRLTGVAFDAFEEKPSEASASKGETKDKNDTAEDDYDEQHDEL